MVMFAVEKALVFGTGGLTRALHVRFRSLFAAVGVPNGRVVAVNALRVRQRRRTEGYKAIF